MTQTNTIKWAVLDIRGERSYGRIVSLHATAEEASDACDREIERQTAGMRNVATHLMWTVAQVDGAVGERVAYRAS